MDKKEALRRLFQCAELYRDSFAGRKLLFICGNNSYNKISTMDVMFGRRQFLHLTGARIPEGMNIGANRFYELCKDKKLKISEFELDTDGTTEKKLEVLPRMLSSKWLSANMVADYYDRRPVLVTEKLVGNVFACMGFVKDSALSCYVPNTFLSTDMRLSMRNRQRVLAVFRTARGEEYYSELIYSAKGVDWGRLRLPNEYKYLSSFLADGSPKK